jgi:hypothetical protein
MSEERSMRDDLLEAAPGVVRISAAAWLRTAEWAVDQAGRMLGIETRADDLEESRRQRQEDCTQAALRARGAELLRQSADVEIEQETHPAYGRILDDLAPDEIRMLRFLAVEGAQPTVDVRSGWLPLNMGSELVAPGLSMIGPEAGCRFPERVPAYLNNLFRLGLIWFSPEALEPLRYQVLEAQPEVVEAMRRAGHARTVRRSILLTPFGSDFCAVVLPLDPAGQGAEIAPPAPDDPTAEA